jgi:hypothetical protein
LNFDCIQQSQFDISEIRQHQSVNLVTYEMYSDAQAVSQAEYVISAQEIAKPRNPLSLSSSEAAIRRHTELPFNPWLRLPIDIAETIANKLFPGKTLTGNKIATLAALLANAQNAYRDNKWIHYSRSDEYYRLNSELMPDWFNRTFMLWAIDALADAGLITHEQSPSGCQVQYRSRFWPLAALRSLMRYAQVHFAPARNNPTIELRIDGKPVGFKQSKAIRRMDAEMQRINEALGQLNWQTNHTSAQLNGNVLTVNGNTMRADFYGMTRIFSGDFNNCGRLYRHPIQQLPKVVRDTLTFNGQRTCEIDFSALHPRLLFAAAGLDPKIGDNRFDPYHISDLPDLERYIDHNSAVEPQKQLRCVIKRAVMAMINSEKRVTAECAITSDLAKTRGAPKGKHISKKPGSKKSRDYFQGDKQDRDNARAIYVAIEASLPQLAKFWGTGAGKKLQRADSDLAVRIMLRLLDQGIIAVPVHDSFIVDVRHKAKLAAIMYEELRATCNELRQEGLGSATGQSKSPAAMPAMPPDPYYDTDEPPADWYLETDTQLQYELAHLAECHEDFECDCNDEQQLAEFQHIYRKVERSQGKRNIYKRLYIQYDFSKPFAMDDGTYF